MKDFNPENLCYNDLLVEAKLINDDAERYEKAAKLYSDRLNKTIDIIVTAIDNGIITDEDLINELDDVLDLELQEDFTFELNLTVEGTVKAPRKSKPSWSDFEISDIMFEYESVRNFTVTDGNLSSWDAE